MRHLAWFSCGAASAVMAKLALQIYKNVEVVTCNTRADEHPDNERFLLEVQDWLGVEIVQLKSDKFESVDDVIEKRGYMAGIHGAPCTIELKKKVREAYQEPDDVHVFGYSAEKSEVSRVKRFVKNMPELKIRTPLIKHGIYKQNCINELLAVGIEIPVMYRLGYNNNNCIGCVKASSLSYWNKIKKDFPNVFEKRAQQEEATGAALNKIYRNGVRQRLTLRELKDGMGRDEKPYDVECGVFCERVLN